MRVVRSIYFGAQALLMKASKFDMAKGMKNKL